MFVTSKGQMLDSSFQSTLLEGKLRTSVNATKLANKKYMIAIVYKTALKTVSSEK